MNCSGEPEDFRNVHFLWESFTQILDGGARDRGAPQHFHRHCDTGTVESIVEMFNDLCDTCQTVHNGSFEYFAAELVQFHSVAEHVILGIDTSSVIPVTDLITMGNVIGSIAQYYDDVRYKAGVHLHTGVDERIAFCIRMLTHRTFSPSLSLFTRVLFCFCCVF